jgi:hypothetical protein
VQTILCNLRCSNMSKFTLVLLTGIFALSILASIPTAATPKEEVAVARGTTASYVIASAHNYANSYTYTWPAKTVTGATQIRVHFTRLEVEATYDKIYILNSAGTTIQTFGATTATSTYASGVWSSWVTGTTFKVKLVTDSSVAKWGFATDLVEYETSGGSTVTTLTSGVASSSSLAAAAASKMYQITVPSGCTQMVTSVSHATGADFDTYGLMGAQPTTSSYTWRGYTSSNPEVVTYASPAAGVWYIMVYSYSGSGTFTITCTLTTGTSDTTAPTVSVTAPTAGATVSGSVAVTATASDNVGVASVAFYIDSALVLTDTASPYSYTWATTSYANGAHSIYAIAKDAAGNSKTSTTVSVTVSNTVVDDGGALATGVAANGNMDSADGADMWYIDIAANAASMYVVLTCGTSDFDTYGKAGAQPTTSVYDWRGYTSGGEENTVTSPASGRYYIMVDYYSGGGAYQLTATVTYGTTPPDPQPTGNKYAVLVGISNYKSINDLSFCDEDVTDFFHYLTTVCGYSAANIRILGDGSSSYPQTAWGKATEANYKACLTWLAGVAADEITFMTSGHGSGDGSGESYLCAWDCSSGESGEDGNFYDHEIAAILQNAVAAKIFIFIDHCYSGGLGPEIMAMGNKAKVWMTTTCTANGYGYDEPTSSNGAWTNQFVHVTLEQHFADSPSTTMEAAFTYAASGYSHTGGDAPMQFDGNTSASFTI